MALDGRSLRCIKEELEGFSPTPGWIKSISRRKKS